MPKSKKLHAPEITDTELLLKIDANMDKLLLKADNQLQTTRTSPAIPIELVTKIANIDDHIQRLLSIVTNPESLLKSIITKSVQRLVNPLFAMLRQIKKHLNLPKRPPGPARDPAVAQKRYEKNTKHLDHLVSRPPTISEIDETANEQYDEDLEIIETDLEIAPATNQQSSDQIIIKPISPIKSSTSIQSSSKPTAEVALTHKFHMSMSGNLDTDDIPTWKSRLSSLVPKSTLIIITSVEKHELLFTMVSAIVPPKFASLATEDSIKYRIAGRKYLFEKAYI